ncbi:MAG: carB [Rickettsiales bacterium]|jgi:carbamoyl-phosphate synthase large subunit|nr:carB [Rickettsiales bacterium]
MPKRTDIKSILIIGAGPIVIGQACEFDYSGAQACKALKEEGYRVILVNSNPATIMTDPNLADATYIEPITPEFVERIIAKEMPDALLPTVGGQTALNCALALADLGILKKYNVTMIGASRDAIEMAENRQLFKEAMERIGLECPKNLVVHSKEEAWKALEYVGLPAIIRPSFTLGGAGGGVAYNREEFEQIIESGLEASPTREVQVDESLLGWKEYEMEVVRDHADNCIIICSIENIDPMGVHTGDSITVAPALTLTDKEYQIMRNASIAVLREIGVDTGGSNVQFAVNPADGRLVVIEMNPRVSRSSALASKATGFPIAKVAAKLAVGYTLDEIRNDCTKTTPASFEPVIDYVVTKIPRFTFEKFKGTKQELSSSMKSVGEAMAIGRSFPESLQKALRSMETGLTGLNEVHIEGNGEDENAIIAALAPLSPNRILIAAQAIRLGFPLARIHEVTKFDPWFLEQLKHLVDVEATIRKNGLPTDKHGMLALKKLGFSDARLAELTGRSQDTVRTHRRQLGVRPVYKRVDTCAAEFASATPYMYSCYEGDGVTDAECESQPTANEKIFILGGGPNRIGQGIEFDYCCVQAAYALKEAGYETVMVNCNPETVSTDYDTSDRLYFEPLTAEDVIELITTEQKNGKVKGVVVQFGGQTPLKLAAALEKAGIPIIGTSPDAIDLSEDRERFKALLDKVKLRQPANDTGRSAEELEKKAEKMGFPLVVRPSYVLGGRAMEIVYDQDGLKNYLKNATEFFKDGPLLVDSFLTNAIEVDVDAICDGEDVFIAGIMEHIEEAGIHSGDSACSLPPYSLSPELIEEIRKQTKVLAIALHVKGLMNVQFAIQGTDIYILEVNPRASRTVPFVAKTIGIPVAKIAARVMAGEKIKSFNLTEPILKHVAVKEAVFPFARFPGVDVLLGPEMKSTGEVMGIDTTFDRAFAKAQIASNNPIPQKGTVFISVKEADKPIAAGLAKELLELGFKVVATRGTASFMKKEGVEVGQVNKVLEGRPHIVDMMKDGGIDFVINTTEGAQAIADSFDIRRTALLGKIPYCTTISGARALVMSIKRIREDKGLEVKSIQAYFS